MIEISQNRKKMEFLINNYFVFAIYVYFFTLLVPGMRPGVVMTLVLVTMLLELFLNKRFLVVNSLDIAVLAFVFFNAISCLWIFETDFTYSAFLQEIITTIFPIIVYFSAKYCNGKKMLYTTWLAIIICIAIGIVLYVTLPSGYCEYLANMGFAATKNPWNCRQGLCSFIGRIAMGSYSVLGMAISFYMYGVRLVKPIYAIASFYFMFVACLLTSQRSAIVGAIILVIVFSFKIFKESFSDLIKYIPFLGLVFVIFLIYANKQNLFENLQLFSKISAITESFSERSGYWIDAISYIDNIIVGNGLGTAGHRAIGISTVYVTDGNFVKMLVETGILGCTIFFVVVLCFYYKKLKRIEQNYLSLFVVSFILFQALGSNVFSTQIIAPIFWFFLGFEEKRLNAKLNNKNV